jgi:RecB family exonuclease
VEDLLWHAWDNSAPSKTWPKLSLGVDEVALQVARNLDSVVALFGAAARYVERNPLGTAIEFVEQQLSLKLPEDTIGFSANAQHSVSLLTPAGLIGRRFKVLALAHLQEGIWPNLRPRSSLLGAQSLDISLQNSQLEVAAQQRSELPAELRMLYKAVGAATEKLLLSAIDTEEEQVSQFVRALAGHDVPAEEYTEDRLTLRGLVGSLRRDLIRAKTDGERLGIAVHLARLANEGVPGAHPNSWYGMAEPSTTDPLAELGVSSENPNQLVLHPSELDNFVRCPLHWFISAHGGSDQNFKTRVGTLMHEVLEKATSIDEESFWNIVQSKWHTVEFDSDWQEASERRRVRKMISKLLGYLTSFEAERGIVIGREVDFQLEVAGAQVRGKVDRIELYPNGDIVIADLKTSKYAIKKDVETNPQLGVYQLAALAERFTEIPQLQSDPQLAGAVLLEIGTKEAQVVAKQDSLKTNPQLREAFEAQLAEITDGMLMQNQTFTAKITEHCNAEYTFGSCSLHLIEQVSYGR